MIADPPAPDLQGVARLMAARTPGDPLLTELANLLDAVGRADANGEGVPVEIFDQTWAVATTWLMGELGR